MKQLILISLISVCALWSCGPDGKTHEHEQGKGGVYYGGVFRMNEVEDFRSLYPLNITEVVGHRITNQIYEGLVKYDQKDLKILPALATSWDINENATKFTLHLRSGVKFHDDPCFPGGEGRVVTANDFKYCFTKLCSSDLQNQGFWVFKNRVIGADEYYQSTI